MAALVGILEVGPYEPGGVTLDESVWAVFQSSVPLRANGQPKSLMFYIGVDRIRSGPPFPRKAGGPDHHPPDPPMVGAVLSSFHNGLRVTFRQACPRGWLLRR